MTKSPPKDIGASVRAPLASRARAGRGLSARAYALRERAPLFRLASSRLAPRFVLNGAALFTLWTRKPHRATRDSDLLGFGGPGVDHVREVFAEVFALDVADGGVRLEPLARITNGQVRLRVDVGFGDAITPEPRVVDFPAPRLRAYPRETVVAEKLEAMVQLGMANSRMKDFYDVAVLARNFDFDGALLARAVRATFERRKTALPTITTRRAHSGIHR